MSIRRKLGQTRQPRLDRRITAGLYTLGIAAAMLALVPTAAAATRTTLAPTHLAAQPAAVVNPNAVPGPPTGFTTTWSDDFTGAAGTGLNTEHGSTTPARVRASAPARSRR